MAKNVDNSAPVDVDVEDVSERREPALELPSLDDMPVRSEAVLPEAVLDAEFDDVSRQAPVVEEKSPSAKVNTPLQDRPVPRISIEAFCKHRQRFQLYFLLLL